MLLRLQKCFPSVFDPRKQVGSITKAKPYIQHHIKLKHNRPIKHAPRRYSPAQLKAIDQFVKSGLVARVIGSTKSPYASAAVLTPKPNGSWRFYVDFRDVNEATVKNAYPLPYVTDQL